MDRRFVPCSVRKDMFVVKRLRRLGRVCATAFTLFNESPAADGSLSETVELRDFALATSGDYRPFSDWPSEALEPGGFSAEQAADARNELTRE